MQTDLRDWLRAHERISARALTAFVDAHAQGVRVTLSALADDPAAEDLLAPQLLLALEALDTDPDRLRVLWPGDLQELDLLAEAFGRPYSR